VTPPRQWTGREAAALRAAMHLSLEEFGRDVGVSARTVSNWEARGELMVPAAGSQRLLNKAYRAAQPDALALFHGLTATPALQSPQPQAVPAPTEEDATLRRTFISAAASAAAAVLAALDGELDKCWLTLDRGSASEARVAHFEAQAEALGARAVQDTPAVVLPEALRTMQAINVLLAERQPTRHQARLVRVTAMLATVCGECLFNSGRFGEAAAWYSCARHAAADAGDARLADYALCGTAYVPTYSGDPEGVIALLEPRLAVASARGPAVAWLWGLAARAYAMTGRRVAFARAIDQARDALSRSAAEEVRDGIFSYKPEKLEFYESAGAVLLSDPSRALAAADRAIGLYPEGETTEPTLARLQKASALALAGEVPEACRVATAAIIDPGTYHGVTVRQYAAAFDGRLPDDSPDVRAWRDVRAAVHAQAIA
jgi:transcriptional regulator with XRE-family HTH domain